MRSLRARLSWGVAAGLLAVLSLGAWLAHRTGRRVLENQFDDWLRSRIAVYMSLIDQEGDRGELDLLGEALVEETAIGPPEFAQFWTQSGDTIYRTPSLAAYGDLPRRTAGEDEPTIWQAALPDGRPGRWVGVLTPVRKVEPDPDEPDAGPPEPLLVHLVVGVHRERLDRLEALLASGLAGAALLLVLTGAGIAWLAVRRGLAPLDRFAERVRGIDVATLSDDFDAGERPAELDPVVAGIEDLKSRVDAALRREKRLAATIAHEFRTPFSELRALTEVALQDGDDLAFQQRALERVHGIAVRMTALLELIRGLTRLEGARGELPRERVALEDLVERVLGPLAASIRDRRLSVGREGLGATTIHVNRTALESIATNLLANAVEYAPAGSTIVCRTEDGAHGPRLCFENPCTDLSPQDLEHLAEPFWRGDPARSRPDHHGLGLNIAQGMARLAGLGLRFSMDGGSFRAEVQLPPA